MADMIDNVDKVIPSKVLLQRLKLMINENKISTISVKLDSIDTANTNGHKLLVIYKSNYIQGMTLGISCADIKEIDVALDSASLEHYTAIKVSLRFTPRFFGSYPRCDIIQRAFNFVTTAMLNKGASNNQMIAAFVAFATAGYMTANVKPGEKIKKNMPNTVYKAVKDTIGEPIQYKKNKDMLMKAITFVEPFPDEVSGFIEEVKPVISKGPVKAFAGDLISFD